MWRLAAPILAFILMGASFLRAGSVIMVAASVVLLLLLAVPRRWAARLAQFALLLAAVRWLWMCWMIAGTRAAAGAPYARLVVILATVAAFTVLAALVFQHRRLQRFYGHDDSADRVIHG
jgi:hypothetical protein